MNININKTYAIELDYEYGMVFIFLDKILSIALNRYSEGEGAVVIFNLPYITHSKPFDTYENARKYYNQILKEINDAKLDCGCNKK